MNKVISSDGTSIAYDNTGNGPALVLVDGAFCYREYGTTPELVPLLSSHFTVYSYDRRGRGESSDTQPYSIDNEVEDLKRIIERTGEEPFICGFSSGAALIIHALGLGIRTKKIALFEPPYTAGTTGNTAPPAESEKILADLVREGKRGEAVKYFMTKIMGMPAIMVFLLKIFGKSMWEKNESVANTLPYDVAIMGNYTVPEKITAAIKIPAIVIGGEKSPGNMKNAIETVARSIPGSQIKWLKGQSHNVPMKVLAPVLIDFFDL